MTHTCKTVSEMMCDRIPGTLKGKSDYPFDLTRIYPWRVYVAWSWRCLTCAVSLQWSKHWHFSIIPKMLFIIVKVRRGGLYHFLFGLLLREYLDRVLFVFQILLLSLLLPQHRPDLPHRIAHMFKTEPWTLKQIIHVATSVFPREEKDGIMMTFQCY